MAEKVARDIRKRHSAEDKIRIVPEGLRGEENLAAIRRREAIAESLCYAWSMERLEAGNTAPCRRNGRVMELRHEPRALQEFVAGQVLELRLLKARCPAIARAGASRR